MPRVHIITIGDELLAGDVVDTNATFLAARCRHLGLEVHRVVSVRDRVEEIRRALEEAAREAEICLVGGGLGPTSDDLTTAAVAVAAGVELRRDEAAAERLTEKFRALGRPMPSRNLKQADFPAGASVLANPIGTAEGFALALALGSHCTVFVMPGVPRELERMMLEEVEPRIAAELTLEPCPRRTYRVLGMGESAVADRIAPVLAAAAARSPGLAAVYVHYRAASPEVFVTLEALRGPEGARASLDELCSLDEPMRGALAPALYGFGDLSLPERLLRALSNHRLTVGFAESCTGGGACRRLAAISGASSVLRGGVVAYDNGLKRELLNVPQDVLSVHGAVSEPVAVAMAAGARQTLHTDLAVSITGIAGPTGGSEDKPVGTVHVAVADEQGFLHQRLRLRGGRVDVQAAAELWAHKLLWDRLCARDLARIEDL